MRRSKIQRRRRLLWLVTVGAAVAAISATVLLLGGRSAWWYVAFFLSVGVVMLGVLGLITRFATESLVRGVRDGHRGRDG